MRLDDELRQDLNREYKRIEDCDKIQDDHARKFSNDDKRLAVIETYNRIQLWILAAIGTGVVTILVNMILGE